MTLLVCGFMLFLKGSLHPQGYDTHDEWFNRVKSLGIIVIFFSILGLAVL